MLFTNSQLIATALACLGIAWLVSEAGIGAISMAGMITFICGSCFSAEDDDNN